MDKNNTAISNKVDVRKKINSRKVAVIRFDGLVTRNRVVSKASDGIDIESSNKADITKKPHFKDGIVTRVQNELNSRSANNHVDNFASCNFTNVMANPSWQILLAIYHLSQFIILIIFSLFITDYWLI